MQQTAIQRLKKILVDKSGSALLLSMGVLLGLLLLCSPIYVFAQCNTQMSFIKETSQNAIDVYTVKTGKDIMASVKNGNDFTKIIDKARFVNDFKEELSFKKGSFTGFAGSDQLLEVSNIKVDFLIDKALKTKVSYTVVYKFYFMSKPLFEKDFYINQEGRYNLK